MTQHDDFMLAGDDRPELLGEALDEYGDEYGTEAQMDQTTKLLKLALELMPEQQLELFYNKREVRAVVNGEYDEADPEVDNDDDTL